MKILQKIQAVNRNPNKNYHTEVLSILYRDMHLSFKVLINIQGKYTWPVSANKIIHNDNQWRI